MKSKPSLFAAVVIGIAIALTVGVSTGQGQLTGGGLTKVTTNSPGLLAGSGTTSNPLTATISVGAGLSGTGSSGAPLAATATGDVTGVTVTNPACSAGSFISSLTGGASGGDVPIGGGCTSEVGDVAGITTASGSGLAGGCTSGTCSLGLDLSIWQLGGSLAIGLPGDPDDHVYNNWAPAGLATSPVLQVTAADNYGSVITGIDAIGASIAVGTRRVICNTNAPQDDGILAFQAEDTRSTANNRIWTPGYGRDLGQTAVDRYTIGPSSCVELIYMQPDQTTSATKRWLIIDSTRFGQATTKHLAIFPPTRPAALSGTVNDWAPTDTCPGFTSAAGDSCEGGANTASTSYSLVIATTVDATGATVTGMDYSSSHHADGQGPIRWILNQGPGPITLKQTSLSSAAGNRFSFGGSAFADYVLGAGDSVMLWHDRDGDYWFPLGGFDHVIEGRDLRMMGGATIDGIVPSTTVSLDLQPSFTGRTASYSGARILNAATFNTAGGALSNVGLNVAISSTKTGASGLDNVGAQLQVTGGTSNYALISSGGIVYWGLGTKMSTYYVNSSDTSFSERVDVQSDFRVGASAFGGSERYKIFGTNGHHRVLGTAPTDSANCDGSGAATVVGTDVAFKVTTGAGATACTMTFASSYTNPPICTVMPEGTTTLPTCTISATAITCTVVAASTAYNFSCVGPTGST